MSSDIYNSYKGKAYRFTPIEALIATITNKKLRFTRIDKYNDPLDCSPYLAPFNWEKYYNKNYLLNELKNIYFEKFFENFYACCFCKEYDTENSYLMWSHYGKDHSQLCFEIDFSKYDYLGCPSEIMYPNDIVSFRDKYKNIIEGGYGLFVTTTKLKVWSYEKEVRLIIDIGKPENKSIISNITERNIDVILNPSIISKIIFGVNSTKICENKLLNILKINNLNPNIEKMLIDPISLKLKSIDYFQYYYNN